MQPKIFAETGIGLLILAGPTGSGKSDLAVALALELGAEVVNYDSVQLHRGLDIGSAKLTLAERQGVPHHLLDVIAADTECTAGEYARRARPILHEISARGRVPILVGGTGFYLRALLDGLSPAPLRDVALRQRLRRVGERRPASLHRMLARRDPLAAARIHPNDRQKLIRALEIDALAGIPASAIQAEPRDALRGFRYLKVGLSPDRSALMRRLNERCLRMFQDGLIQETKQLLDSGIATSAKALQSLGYKQAVRFLAGACTFEEAVTECQIRTRQYAKRQLTWFRADPEIEWLSGFGTQSQIRSEALVKWQNFLRSPDKT